MAHRGALDGALPATTSRAAGRPTAAPPLLLVAGGLVALLTLVPLCYVVYYAATVGPAEATRLLLRGRVGELLVNTVGLILLAAPACAVVGGGAAWLVERTALPGRRVWGALMAAPLAVPAFVNAYAWVSVAPRADGLFGALLIVTLSYFPFVYLPAAAALRGLDPALEESARALGDGPWRTFFRVVVPQLRPALFGGMLLVALHLLSEFGALQMLRFPTFTTAIYDQFQSTFNGAASNMLATVLVTLCGLLLFAELTFAGRHRYARVGVGAARRAVPAKLGRWSAPALALLAALAVLALGVPIGSLLRWLIVGRSTAFPVELLASTTLRSVGLGLGAAAVTTVLALPVAWLWVRHPSPYSTLVERAIYVAHSLPGIVVALALVTVGIRLARPLYQTIPMLLVAYAIMFLPRAVVSLRAALLQAPPVLDEAARSLGSAPAEVFRRVTLPLLAPGVGAGAVLVFLAVITELTATLLLAPTGTQTLATRFWGHADEIAYGAAAPYAALMVLISLPATILLNRDAGPPSG